jgi:hypothetical protein
MKTIFALLLTALLCSCSSQKDTVKFEKIIFHSSRCFGDCPVVHLQVSKDKSILLSKLKSTRMAKMVDGKLSERQEEYEYYTGEISNSLYNELVTAIAKTDTVSFKGPNCCDAPMKSIIAYYNGKRRHIETMFPPEQGEELINVLYKISKSEDLEKTTEKFEIEVDTTKPDNGR